MRLSKIILSLIVLFGVSGVCGAATDPQQLLNDDERKIQQTQEDYRQAVLHYGATSNEAKTAMDRMDAAKNKLEVDKLRVQQLQQAEKQINAPGSAPNPPANPQ